MEPRVFRPGVRRGLKTPASIRTYFSNGNFSFATPTTRKEKS
jgi:hypothetical protein